MLYLGHLPLYQGLGSQSWSCEHVCIYINIYIYLYIHIYVIIYINSYNKNYTIYTSGIFPGMQECFIIVKCIGDARDRGPIPGSGRSLRGNINLLHYSWLESPMDRGAWWATVQKVVKSWTQLTTHRQVKLTDNITASDEDWKCFLWDSETHKNARFCHFYATQHWESQA